MIMSIQGEILMSEKRYVKPCMTNLPKELGERIFKQMDAAIVDRKKLKKESEDFEKRALDAREKNK